MDILKQLIKRLNVELRKDNNFIVIKDIPKDIISELRDCEFYVIDIKNHDSFKILSPFRINPEEEYVKAIIAYEINKQVNS